MPLDPQVQLVLDRIRDAGNPEYWQMSVADARAAPLDCPEVVT